MPSLQDYTSRREDYCAWLTANGINPNDLLLDADVYIETGPDGTRRIAYEACHRDSEGRKQVNERGDGVALELRKTPLLVEPPDWWEPYRKPTRDQLLDAVHLVRAVVDAGPPSELAVHGEWEGGWDSAMEAVKKALDSKVGP